MTLYSNAYMIILYLACLTDHIGSAGIFVHIFVFTNMCTIILHKHFQKYVKKMNICANMYRYSQIFVISKVCYFFYKYLFKEIFVLICVQFFFTNMCTHIHRKNMFAQIGVACVVQLWAKSCSHPQGCGIGLVQFI